MTLISDDELQDKLASRMGPTVSRESIEAIIDKEDFIRVDGTTLTIAVLTLANGFVVTGESASADPSNFDEDVGRRVARDRAFEKIWPLEGYLLREKIVLSKSMADRARDESGQDRPASEDDAGGKDWSDDETEGVPVDDLEKAKTRLEKLRDRRGETKTKDFDAVIAVLADAIEKGGAVQGDGGRDDDSVRVRRSDAMALHGLLGEIAGKDQVDDEAKRDLADASLVLGDAINEGKPKDGDGVGA